MSVMARKIRLYGKSRENFKVGVIIKIIWTLSQIYAIHNLCGTHNLCANDSVFSREIKDPPPPPCLSSKTQKIWDRVDSRAQLVWRLPGNGLLRGKIFAISLLTFCRHRSWSETLSLQHKRKVVMNLIEFLALEVKFCRFSISGWLSWI